MRAAILLLACAVASPLEAQDEAPNKLKQRVLAALTVVRGKVTEPQEGKKLDTVIDRQLRSLQLDLWVDVDRVDPKRGMKVFSEDWYSAETLDDVLAGHHTTADAMLRDLVKGIASADRLLASVAIADAQGKPKPDVREIAKAFTELDKGDRDVAEGKHTTGIEHYYKAWQLAIGK